MCVVLILEIVKYSVAYFLTGKICITILMKKKNEMLLHISVMGQIQNGT